MKRDILRMLATALRSPMRNKGHVRLLCLGSVMAFAPTMASANLDFDCEPIVIIERSNRVGVHCLHPYPGGIDALAIDWIYFITFPKTDQAQMRRFLDFATTAMIEGKYFSVDVPTTADDNINGCLPENCRTIGTPFAIVDR